MTTYYYLLASQQFLLEEEPLDEILRERVRYYQEHKKDVDFWLVKQPAFLETPALKAIKAKVPAKVAAIISTNPQFITWLKLRLEYVLTGEFKTPLEGLSDPLASLEAVV